MNPVLWILVLLAGAWVALTFVHPSLAQATYDMMMSKGGFGIFAFCLVIAMIVTVLHRRK